MYPIKNYLKSVLRNRITFETLISIVYFLLYTYIYKWLFLRDKINKSGVENNISWTEKNMMVRSDEEITLSGKTNTQNISVFIDTKEHEVLFSSCKNPDLFSINLNMNMLPTGWHVITATINDSNNSSSIYFHKISQRRGVIIDAKTIRSAQSKKEKNYCFYHKYLINNYSPIGRYFYSLKDDAATYPISHVSHDSNGIILVQHPRFKRKYVYNPVTIAQHGLQIYYDGISNDIENKKRFLRYADWFVENQRFDGGYPYSFCMLGRGMFRFSGWTGGMAQGQTLSILSRAYYLTHDKKYLEAGFKSLKHLSVSISEKGCSCTLEYFTDLAEELSSYSNNSVVEEYPHIAPDYVLNGDLFALIGLYDWSILATDEYGKAMSKELFWTGCVAVSILLPYYDYYVYSSYSLGQWTRNLPPWFSSLYAHDCHIFLCYTLYELTGIKEFDYYYQRFSEYVS